MWTSYFGSFALMCLPYFFSSPHLSHDSHFSFLPLFIQPPPISRNSPEEETLHPFFLLWYLKGLLWLSIQKLQKQHVVCVFGGLYLGEMLEVFPESILNLCKCLRVLCSAPFPLNKKHLLTHSSVYTCFTSPWRKTKAFLSQRENMSEDRWRDFWLSNVSWVTNCLILFFPTVMWQVWMRNLLTEFTCLHTSCYDLHHFSSLTFAFQHHFPVNCLSSPFIYICFDSLKPGILLWKCTTETSCFIMTEQRLGRLLTLHQFVGLYCDREPIPACGMKQSLLFNLKETLFVFYNPWKQTCFASNTTSLFILCNLGLWVIIGIMLLSATTRQHIHTTHLVCERTQPGG